MQIEKNRALVQECIGDFLNCDCVIDGEMGAKPITFFHWDALNIVHKIEFLSETFHGCDITAGCKHLFKVIEEETEFGKIVAPIEFSNEWLPIGMVGNPVYSDSLDTLYGSDDFQLLMVNLNEHSDGFPLYSIEIDDRITAEGMPSPFLPSLMEMQVVKAG